MDYVLHRYIGYITESRRDECARIIQRAYRNHRSYELARREDIIRRRISSVVDTIYNDQDEILYWNSLRDNVLSCMWQRI